MPHRVPFTAADVYNLVLRLIARIAVWTTTFTQRGSLPVYVGTIFVVFVAAEGTAPVRQRDWQISLDAWQTPMQLVVAPIMIIAGIFAVRARSATPASCWSRRPDSAWSPCSRPVGRPTSR
jgi:multicomponent Na+:H+ antiporter subunit A